MSDGVGRHERLIEMHAVHQRVGGEHFAASSGRLHDGGVVAGADLDPGRDVETAEDALDERMFAEFSYGGIGHEDRRNLTPRFAVWGGRMNLLKQVEPL